MKISDRRVEIASYRPDFINRFREFQALGVSEDIELKRLLESTQWLQEQLYFDTADHTGLGMMAQDIGVVFPADATLEDKRMITRMELASRVAYTKVTLKRMMDGLIGEENYSWRIDFANQTLWVRIDLARKNQRNALYKMLRRVIPACMVIDLDLRYNQLYMLTKFTIEELKQYTVLDLKENPDIKRIYLERGGKLM